MAEASVAVARSGTEHRIVRDGAAISRQNGSCCEARWAALLPNTLYYQAELNKIVARYGAFEGVD